MCGRDIRRVYQLEAALAASQSREQALRAALVELRAAAKAHRATLGHWCSEVGWPNVQRLDAILATEPEARAAQLMAAEVASCPPD